jgi:hypothetical protein
MRKVGSTAGLGYDREKDYPTQAGTTAKVLCAKR